MALGYSRTVCLALVMCLKSDNLSGLRKLVLLEDAVGLTRRTRLDQCPPTGCPFPICRSDSFS